VNAIALEGIAIGFLVLFSAVFSGMETALTSLTAIRARQIMEESGRHRRILQAWVDDSNHVLMTLLVGNNVFNITASSLATDIARRVLEKMGMEGSRGIGIALAVGAMTFLVLVFGELAPKTYAKHNTERFLVLAPIVLVSGKIFGVVAKALSFLTIPIVKGIGGETEGTQEVTGKDIEYMIRVGSESGGLDEEQQELLQSAIEFSGTFVREVMIPRTEIVAYDLDDSVELLYQAIRKQQFSRYPVFKDDLDNIVGIFYARDLLAHRLSAATDDAQAPDIGGMLHAPYLIPESKKIHDLLNEFQAKKIHLAVVVDEFGGTAGIVTMEDLLEELVGEIQDEFDVDEQFVKELSSKRHIVNARIEVDDLKDALGIELPDDPTFTTLGGFLIAQAGVIPEKGSRFPFENFQFVVRDRDERRIKTVEVIQVSEPKSEESME
jgi:magnesium and cobalt exporter, CNNM family